MQNGCTNILQSRYLISSVDYPQIMYFTWGSDWRDLFFFQNHSSCNVGNGALGVCSLVGDHGWVYIRMPFRNKLWIKVGDALLIYILQIKHIIVQRQTKSLSQHVSFPTSVLERGTTLKQSEVWYRPVSLANPEERAASTSPHFTCCFAGDSYSRWLCICFEKGLSRWQANCYLSTQSTLLLKQFCQTDPRILTGLKML